MRITQGALSGEKDLRAMEALARQFRTEDLHVADLPYRLSSWALDDPENVRLWTDASGNLLAWAMLCIPFDSLDFVCRPETETDLLPQILAWADGRSRAHPEMIPLGTPEGKPCWFVNVFADQAARICLLEEAGFADQSDVGENSWSKVFMQRPADLPVKEYRIPEGFVVRPLAGEGEVEAYVQLHRETFRSKNMTVDWRRRTLQHPNHVPELDLVVSAPDGRLAAFCVCWLDPVDAFGQIEPLGCHPDFRGYALGRIALAEGLRRLPAHGAKKICVETDNWRITAFRLYESMGFRVVRDVRVYRRDY
jgi:ribosomal protein S18 acetylase RimI-like enzyme